MKIKWVARTTAMLFGLLLVLLGSQPALACEAVDDDKSSATPTEDTAKRTSEGSSKAKPTTLEDRLLVLEKIIEEQQREIQSLREAVERGGGGRAALPVGATNPPAGAEQAQAGAVAKKQGDSTSQARNSYDELVRRFGSLRITGDIRLRVESNLNQGFDSPVEQADRTRLRLRARLELDGVVNSHFDWGIRLATGNFVDPISSNQTLTDFFERKPFALERAFIRYDSKGETVGVQLVAGKFEPTFRRTQMVWDEDVNVEGASEAVYFRTKTPLQQVRLVAFQLPFNEVSGGKDGVVYGGQLQSDLQFSDKWSATANVALYDWNHADQVVTALGALPTQVNGGLANNLGGVGTQQNGALGTTNRVIRNAAGQPIGFLAGFNLVDFFGNVTWRVTNRFPVTFQLDYVHNATGRVHNEKDGYWAGVQVGQAKEKGDWLFSYTYTRIEQDAVLVPFNFSEILPSNSRAHMPTISYQIANGVRIQWNGLYSQRVNPVFPKSQVNRFLNRNQLDVIYSF